MSGIGGGQRGYGPGGPYRSKPKPYRKYKPLPALIVIAVLAVVAGVVWVQAVTNTADIDEAVQCTPAPTVPEGVTFDPLPVDGLSDATLTPPDRVAVRVLNAGGQRGKAGMTTEALKEFGFTQVGEPGNDDAYANAEAQCHGQLRFGTNGEGAARTVSLIDPCLQLVRDNRKDATVDLAIGTEYNDTRPSKAANEILDKLNAWSAQHQDAGTGEQSTPGRPEISEQLLSDAAPTSC